MTRWPRAGSRSAHDGQFLFTVNTASGTISRFSIATDGTLTLLGSTPVAAQGGVGAVDARLSPDGRYLYVDESKAGAVGTFAVTGGTLIELPTSRPSSPRRHPRRHHRQLTLRPRDRSRGPPAAPVRRPPTGGRYTYHAREV